MYAFGLLDFIKRIFEQGTAVTYLAATVLAGVQMS